MNVKTFLVHFPNLFPPCRIENLSWCLDNYVDIPNSIIHESKDISGLFFQPISSRRVQKSPRSLDTKQIFLFRLFIIVKTFRVYCSKLFPPRRVEKSLWCLDGYMQIFRIRLFLSVNTFLVYSSNLFPPRRLEEPPQRQNRILCRYS